MRKENVHCVVLTLSFLVLFDVTANAEMLFFHWLLPIKTIPSHTCWHGDTSLRKKTRITKDSRGVKSVRLCYFLIWENKKWIVESTPHFGPDMSLAFIELHKGPTPAQHIGEKEVRTLVELKWINIVLIHMQRNVVPLGTVWQMLHF